MQTQPAAAGSGSVTFNGTLQSKQVQTQSAAPGTGTVTIGGTEQHITQDCVHHPCPVTYDTGTVSIIVNGLTTTVSYGQTSTSTTIATALTNAIDGNGSLPVSASLSGTVITLTAKTSGSGTNYPLSTSVTYDSTDFSVASFWATPSGSALTGGRNAAFTTVYDSGTCVITVNAHGDSAS